MQSHIRSLQSQVDLIRVPVMLLGWRGSFEQIVGKVPTGPSPDADCRSGQ